MADGGVIAVDLTTRPPICCGCDTALPSEAPIFTLDLRETTLQFCVCDLCGTAFSLGRKELRAALLERIERIRQELLTRERRAALHPEGGRA
jgi:hypothetical protein